jgi:hypothetical protein
MINNASISEAMTIKLEDLFDDLPEMPDFAEGIRRAPSWRRNFWKNCSPADGYTVTGSGLKDISKAGRSTNIAAAVSRARRFRS